MEKRGKYLYNEDMISASEGKRWSRIYYCKFNITGHLYEFPPLFYPGLFINNYENNISD